MTVELYEVGGCVRDELLGVPTKDIDFTVVASGGWDEMRSFLISEAFEIFLETPQYLTIRARFPPNYWLASGTSVKGLTADLVLARKEGQYTDGRHPDKVEPGTLEDDLRRRDFTVNAMAKDETGQIIDFFDGRKDLEARLIKCVGSPEERFREDYLRALRAVRFAITKGFDLHSSVTDVLTEEWVSKGLAKISIERRREELLKAFKADTFKTLELLRFLGTEFTEAAFAGGICLMPTLKGK